MPAHIIFLTEDQKKIALNEAERRQTYNEKKRLQGRNKAPAFGSSSLTLHQVGALGEMAVAVYLNLQEHVFQAQSAVRGSADLPGDIEVKTRSKHNYDLIVQKDERPDKKIVLVTVEKETIILWGWCTAAEAMKQEYWSDPARGRPAYFMPKKALHSIETLELKAEEKENAYDNRNDSDSGFSDIHSGC